MLTNLRKEPSGNFENFCRMSAIDFEHLLSRIGLLIARQDTNMRESIPMQERLAVALRFFATGDSYSSLSFLFKFSKQTVSRCVDEVCKALIQELKKEIKLPENEDEWLAIAQGFQDQWNFPNCLGAIDGKHVLLQCPNNTITDDINNKGTVSVELLALVDAHYCFTFVDIGCQGQVFNNSSLFPKLKKDELKLPPDGNLPAFDEALPYVFLADPAFALSRHMMIPYPSSIEKECEKRIFNYRLSHARRVVENVFGVLASVFRVFRKPMMLQPEKVSNVTLACVLLHNFMRRSPTSVSSYTPPGTFDTEVDGKFVPGSWRKDESRTTSFMPLKKVARKPSEEGMTTRDSFAEYFNSSGKLPWQDEYC
ncbi:unnamed protein product [Larinioides sclopetarius]